MVPRARAVVVPWLLVSALTFCGCATTPHPLPPLPYGGLPVRQSEFGDFARAWTDVQTPCLAIPFLTARARVRGTVESRRIDALMWVGVGWPIRLRLESWNENRSRFTLMATSEFGSGSAPKDDATLGLPGRRRVVRAHSRELVELVMGVPLSALDLQSVLTGCPAATPALTFVQFDADVIKTISTSDEVMEVFMRRGGNGAPWAVMATVGSVPNRPIRWRADVGERSNGILQSVRLTSVEWTGEVGRRFDVTFSLDKIQTLLPTKEMLNVPLPESPEFIQIDDVRSTLSVPLLAD